MVYDSIANASIPTAASNSKDFAKKKRVNRTAKLKQSKLDVRREQWLSQVKNRGFKEETNGTRGRKMPPPETHAANENERDRPIVKLEISVGVEENEGSMNNYSDSDSPSNSPTSHTSSISESNISVTNFTGSSSRSSCGSSSSSGGCCSESITDEEDPDDGILDDWEAVADALAADDIQKNQEDSSPQDHHHPTPPQPEPVLTTRAGQAWRPDDVSRPQSLPNLLKQNSFPMKSGKSFVIPPSSCPICCEDLDMTDSSFLPCPCGYRLCLFCHKRILEDNGRCPGCRKEYEHHENAAALKLDRCHSMSMNMNMNPSY